MSLLTIVAMHVGLVGETSGIGAVLTYTQPLFVSCLAVPFLKEKVSVTKLLGVSIGFIGVLILFSGREGSFTLNSSYLMIFAAVSWAASVVYYKKHLSRVDPFIANFFQMVVSVLPLSVFSLITENFVFPVDSPYLWIILYASLGPLAVGWTIWLFLIREEEATVVSGSSLIVPLAAMFFGWQLLGESLSTQSMLGTVLILLGVYLVNLRSMKERT